MVDVRSPKEFNQGHIPNAINIPLFSDKERAQIGTAYKQVNREEAILQGLELVGPKMKDFVLKARSLNSKDKLLVHCWRGGMRSESMAWLFNTSDITAATLYKGYKAFRNHIQSFFSKPFQFIVISGSTGSGKTEILHELRSQGEQVIDLEDIANHKGSVFGGLGKPEQPTTEQFQNNLFWKLKDLDASKIIWLEDESIAIGKVFIPNPFWEQKIKSPIIKVELAKKERVKRLVNEYGSFDKSQLEERMVQIERKLGGQHLKKAVEHLNAGDLSACTDILLTYYDKAYKNAIGRKENLLIETISSNSFDAPSVAKKLIQIIEEKHRMETVKLTQFSHGAGCGCKISPKILEDILGKGIPRLDPNLLVGNSTKDDAAVYDLGNGKAIISTTDFFMPIVDDPFDFGAIASVNAMSDVYAMGGKPLMAIAILGWPIDKVPTEVAGRVLEGSRSACNKAGISLAGGHSIDCPEPIFGLAVTGQVDIKNIKKNSTAKEGSYLFLTKKIGVGTVTTAQKKGLAKPGHLEEAKKSMLTLNDLGEKLGQLDYVNSLTDVTGFGLLGHLIEICESSNLSAEIEFEAVPKFDFVDEYITQNCIPGGTNRNWDSYGHHVSEISDYQRAILADPQTSGGLLISIDHNSLEDFDKECKHWGINLIPIGRLTTKSCVGIQII